MRQAERLSRRVAAAQLAGWITIRIVLKRDELGLPTFWPLQLAGWVCFYLLVFAAAFPYRHQPGSLRANGFFVLAMFGSSCLLHPLCRRLMRQGHSWIGLEIRALGWCLLTGSVAGLATELAILDIQPLDWAEGIGSSVQGAVVLFLWCSLYFSIKQWQQSARERERLLHAEAEVREARLSALRYQLNPHFLFNSLNAVSTLVLEGNAPAATRMLSQIADLLRTTLEKEVVSETSLSEELQFTKRYLAIEQTRLGGRLHVAMDVSPDAVDALVPGMLLQPLVENAVRHGIAPLVEGGTIRIQAQVYDSQLHIAVQNSGVRRADNPSGTPRFNGIGIGNTVKRLKALYGDEHKFVFQWPAEGGCCVLLELPFRQASERQDIRYAHTDR